jgi:hypothetical protein
MQQTRMQSVIETMPIDDLRAQFDTIMNEVVVFYQDNKQEKVKSEYQQVKRQATNGVPISSKRLYE